MMELYITFFSKHIYYNKEVLRDIQIVQYATDSQKPMNGPFVQNEKPKYDVLF